MPRLTKLVPLISDRLKHDKGLNMSDGKSSKSSWIQSVAATVLVGLLAGGTAPWWWERVARIGTANVDQGAETTRKDHRVFMKISPIKLFPEDPEAEVQLSVFVNGTEYRHPSVAGVEWMKIGPSMNDKIIEVPRDDWYQVRFEMRMRDGDVYETSTPVIRTSQQVTPVMKKELPYKEEYRLYPVQDSTRSATVAALVTYEIYER
jgi:hypothetical protein